MLPQLLLYLLPQPSLLPQLPPSDTPELPSPPQLLLDTDLPELLLPQLVPSPLPQLLLDTDLPQLLPDTDSGLLTNKLTMEAPKYHPSKNPDQKAKYNEIRQNQNFTTSKLLNQIGDITIDS